MRIYQLGYPGPTGGANTECWHTVRLWRLAGWEVNMVPTWGADSETEAKLDSIGVRTHHVAPDRLCDVPGLAGSVVVGMCNSRFCESVERLRALDCRLVWVPCMCFMFGHERRAWTRFGPPDAWVFQSRFQMGQHELLAKHHGFTSEKAFHIHGAFWPDEFPFRYRGRTEAGESFVVGKLSRADVDKWSADHFRILGRVPNIRALCMGWSPMIAGQLGEPPPWALCRPVNDIPVCDFYAQCHALLALGGPASENWPRVGLEAMAAGVPVLAQNAWGWQEMIVDGESGYLCNTPADYIERLRRLEADEPERRRLAEGGRARVEALSEPGPLIDRWRAVFEYAAMGTRAESEVVA